MSMNINTADILSKNKIISSSGVFTGEHPGNGLPCLSYSFMPRDPEVNGVIAVLTNFIIGVSSSEELHSVVKLISGLEISGALKIYSTGHYKGRLLTTNGKEMTPIVELDIEPYVPLKNI